MKSARFGVAGTLTTTARLWTHYIPGIALMCGFLAETWKPLGARRLALFGAGVTAGRIPWIPDEMGTL